MPSRNPRIPRSRRQAHHDTVQVSGQAKDRAFLVGIETKSRRREVPGMARNAARLAEESNLAFGKEQCADLPTLDKKAEEAAGRESATKSGTSFGADESMAELRELACSAGAEIAGEFLQSKQRPDPATLVGRGKLEEISGVLASSGANLLIFDHDLSPSQQRNIEDAVGARVIDRTQLILDIFARHARTREGQLQVELAQLEYLLPRLSGRGAEMSQLGGGIGTRGPGETQLETDRRKIYRRIRDTQKQLEHVRRIRTQQRQRRESAPVATVALVGYTNAGKSTLFNALTQASVVASPRMFATLDPTIRSVTLPSRRKALLSDTVGFIRNLPHGLITSFRATLEEVQRAALLLHVCDSTSPQGREQETQVKRVLDELEVSHTPQIRVLNKIDLLPPLAREGLRDDAATIHVSARTGAGVAQLLEAIDESLHQDPLSRVRLNIPQREGKALAQLQAGARIFARNYRDGVVELEAQAPESLLRKLERFVVR